MHIFLLILFSLFFLSCYFMLISFLLKLFFFFSTYDHGAWISVLWEQEVVRNMAVLNLSLVAKEPIYNFELGNTNNNKNTPSWTWDPASFYKLGFVFNKLQGIFFAGAHFWPGRLFWSRVCHSRCRMEVVCARLSTKNSGGYTNIMIVLTMRRAFVMVVPWDRIPVHLYFILECTQKHTWSIPGMSNNVETLNARNVRLLYNLEQGKTASGQWLRFLFWSPLITFEGIYVYPYREVLRVIFSLVILIGTAGADQ